MAFEGVIPGLGSLLQAAGCEPGAFEVTAVSTGGNNRVHVVDAGGERFVVKNYYRDADDPRDRLKAEYDFLQHAWECGLRNVPRPFACDPALGLALYEHIAGRRLDGPEIDAARVAEAARFLAALNTEDSRARGVRLATASEASFSVVEHLRSVDRRIERLALIRVTTSADRQAAALSGELAAAWAGTSRRILAETADPEAPIPDRWRILSPSDFGFHNALLRPSGALCFLDFEYAGWDDPAKMISDFFAHPGVPVPPEHWNLFVAEALGSSEDGAALAARARWLEPVFRTRWCCILLNEFLPDASRRRRFADPDADLETVKKQQLEKARATLDALLRC